MKHLGQNAGAAFIAIAIVAPILWMLLDREPPFIVTDGRVIPPNPTSNGLIEVVWDITPVRSCQPYSSATVTRTITDSKGVQHTYAPVHAIYGTPDQHEAGLIDRTIPLPENITGSAQYSSVACYPCNPLQYLLGLPICIRMPAVPFEIAPAKDGT